MEYQEKRKIAAKTIDKTSDAKQRIAKVAAMRSKQVKPFQGQMGAQRITERP